MQRDLKTEQDKQKNLQMKLDQSGKDRAQVDHEEKDQIAKLKRELLQEKEELKNQSNKVKQLKSNIVTKDKQINSQSDQLKTLQDKLKLSE